MDDVGDLHRRIHSLCRMATRIEAHAGDLHALAHEPRRLGLEGDRSGFESRPPPGWAADQTRAGDLWARIATTVARAEADLVGLERAMVALFYAGSTSPEPTRGSMISRADFDGLVTRQRSRDDTPARLIDQPQHPGSQR